MYVCIFATTAVQCVTDRYYNIYDAASEKINKNNGIQSVNQYDEQKICLVTPKEETNTAIA